MDKIDEVSVEPCVNSKYVQPYRVKYKQNGCSKIWDCIKMHDSISVLIFNKTRKAFVLVKQFRPAVYMSRHKPLWENSHVFTTSLSQKPTSTTGNSDSDPPPAKRSAIADSTTDGPTQKYEPGSVGCTYELCAGIIDKSTSREQIAKEEILEETGYDISVESLEFINSHYSSIGTGGTHQSMYYCEVTDDMLITKGGGNTHEGELIEVVYVPVDEAMKMVFDASKAKSVGLCFAFVWFNQFKRPHLKL